VVPAAVVPAPVPQATKPPVAKKREIQPVNALGDFVADLERSLGEDFFPPAEAVMDVPAAPAATQPWPTAPPAAAKPESNPAAVAQAATTVAQPIASAPAVPVARAAAANASHETSSVSVSLPQRPPTVIPPPSAFASSSASVDLSDMFGELKQELEQDTATADEDPETHYNLGVAFREMGLLDEAIGELQKVCSAVDRGHAFPQLMQTYTWLAQCFLDKGVPEAAIRWYEQALKIPNLDQETKVALHYELASAHEAAQNKPAALTHFMEVYGNNIDYRDVSERIKVLKS
jgi:hypothetical protein